MENEIEEIKRRLDTVRAEVPLFKAVSDFAGKGSEAEPPAKMKVCANRNNFDLLVNNFPWKPSIYINLNSVGIH